MFAGLPGIGVGTLFYVLIALWMPVRELVRVARGTSSIERWRVILRQLSFAVSIVLSVMLAERVFMWILGAAGPESVSPARFLTQELGAKAPESFLAAPVTVSLILLCGVLLTIEVLRAISAARHTRRAKRIEIGDAFRNEALNSTPR